MDVKYFFSRFFVQLLLIVVAIAATIVLFGFFYMIVCFYGREVGSIGCALLIFFGIWLLWKKRNEPLPKFARAIFCVYAVCALITELLPDPQASLLAAHYWCAVGFLASVAVWRGTNALVGSHPKTHG